MLQPVNRIYEPEADTRSYVSNGTTHFRTIDFTNFTPHPVVVVDRQNIPVILPPAPPGTNLNNPRIEIRTFYQFFGVENIREMANVINFINTKLASLGNDRKILYDTLTVEKLDSYKGHLSFTTIRKIPCKDLETVGALLDQGSGFMFTMNNKHLTTVHPESLEGKMIGNHTEFVTARPVGILIEIVDNERIIRERFTYANNNVLQVPAIQDVNRNSGVYVSYVRDVGFEKSIVDTKTMTLEEAEKELGLYRTKEEAMTNGNPELISKNLLERSKLELEELRNVASRMEAENRQLEAEYKQKLIVLESSQKEMILTLETDNKLKASEIVKLKEEVEKRKLVRDEYYETRSSDRKDASEMIKFIPAVLMGFIGAAILFRK